MEKNGLRRQALESIDRVKWIPHWAMTGSTNDPEPPRLVHLRQRAWGVPIVAFACASCGEVFTEESLVEYVSRLFENGEPMPGSTFQ